MKHLKHAVSCAKKIRRFIDAKFGKKDCLKLDQQHCLELAKTHEVSATDVNCALMNVVIEELALAVYCSLSSHVSHFFSFSNFD